MHGDGVLVAGNGFGQTRHFDVMTITWLQGLHLAAAPLRIGSEISSCLRHTLVCSRYLA